MNEYLDAAMQTARFDQLTNRGWFGALPQFHVVMPAAESRQDCSWARRDDLKAAVRDALQRGRPLPVIVGVETPTLEQTAYWSAGGQSARRRAPGQPKGHDRWCGAAQSVDTAPPWHLSRRWEAVAGQPR